VRSSRFHYKSSKSDRELEALWSDLRDKQPETFEAWIRLHKYCDRTLVDNRSQFSDQYEKLQSGIWLYLQKHIFVNMDIEDGDNSRIFEELLRNTYQDMLFYFSDNMDNERYLGNFHG